MLGAVFLKRLVEMTATYQDSTVHLQPVHANIMWWRESVQFREVILERYSKLQSDIGSLSTTEAIERAC